jgi:hypothetical protein
VRGDAVVAPGAQLRGRAAQQARHVALLARLAEAVHEPCGPPGARPVKPARQVTLARLFAPTGERRRGSSARWAAQGRQAKDGRRSAQRAARAPAASAATLCAGSGRRPNATGLRAEWSGGAAPRDCQVKYGRHSVVNTVCTLAAPASPRCSAANASAAASHTAAAAILAPAQRSLGGRRSPPVQDASALAQQRLRRYGLRPHAEQAPGCQARLHDPARPARVADARQKCYIQSHVCAVMQPIRFTPAPCSRRLRQTQHQGSVPGPD